ncbi:MAG: BlaI/MecI/CopY family transcriptional regulator [Planctomycetota bacterium]
MARPKNPELTDRELAVMQVFWQTEEATAEQARQALLKEGEEIAYVTIANVVRGLLQKGFLKQTYFDRPFRYTAIRTFDDVSKKLMGDFMGRLFQGSRQAMLVQLLNYRKLSKTERQLLEQILNESEGKS